MLERRLDKTVFRDDLFTMFDGADRTKKAHFQLSGITSGQTRTLTVPNASGTICLIDGSQSPVFAGLTVGTLTFADGSITDSGGTIDFGNEILTVSNYIDCAYLLTGGTGVKILDDTGETYHLNFRSGPTALTAERLLYFDVGDAARTITLSGNPTMGDWFDQSVKSTADVVHNDITSTGIITGETLVSIQGDIGLQADTDLLQLAANALTVNGTATINGTLFVPDFIAHSGDTDTFISFTGNRIDFYAGNLNFLRLIEAPKASDEAVFNEAGVDIDFRVEAVGEANALFVQGSDGYVGIGTGTPASALQMGNDKLIAVDTNAGITASTEQSQGQGALTAQVNEISTVANDGDNVTLPTAVTGLEIEIINNGAETLQIFPASGDNLGLGVNASEELEANERVKFVAYDTTNWAKESTTEIIHAEIHDEDNTDAFVVNAEDDFHSYHTNGLAAGDLADWIFDAGGAGTSFPIVSIADGADSGVDIAVTTTGLHGLAVGDIISQTNLANAAYVGVFEVKAIISTTVYEVAAVYTATGTGTMDQAATLEADAVAAGVYSFSYCISATPVGNNETFDFQLYKEATAITGSKIRRKFGAGGDFGSMAGCGVISVSNGEKISFALSNEDTAANIIIRNLTIVLIRL